jgi:Phytanoyl-CoA dioxygenase (PhyH)
MLTCSVLRDPQANEAFHKNGYVKIGRIDASAVQALTELNSRLSIPDYFGCGFNVGMNTDILELRRKMQDEINEIMIPYTNQMLDEFTPYTASFLNKLPRNDCFVIAHQDFTYTDETKYPSFMCFIPLVDTTLENAALGFIPGSNLYYDYIRAFPFPGVPTPVTANDTELMLYFDIIHMKAGEMVFFSHNTIHGSFSNYSNQPRPAVGMSFVKNGTQPNLFVHNPENGGKTILRYEVDRYSLVNYNNPHMKAMYESGHIDLPYPLLEEIEYTGVDTSWVGIHKKLTDGGLRPNPAYKPLIEDYRKIDKKRKKRSIFQRIKETF